MRWTTEGARRELHHGDEVRASFWPASGGGWHVHIEEGGGTVQPTTHVMTTESKLRRALEDTVRRVDRVRSMNR